MERNYNLQALIKKSLCRIVFVNDHETAMNLKAYFMEKNPTYVSEINNHLLPYHKIGPLKFKNKKTLLKLLCNTKEVKSILCEDGKAYAIDYVKSELEKMELSGLADRVPAAMSYLQRTRASYLYNILDGKAEFLLCDCKSEKVEDIEKQIKIKTPYFTIAEYIRCSDQYDFDMYELVWITELSIDEMLELLGVSAKEKDYSFFSLDGTDVFELDKEKLLNGFVKTKAPAAKPTVQGTKPAASVKDAEFAYNEASKYDRFQRTGNPQYSGTDNLKKAFELYKTAAEIGHPGAQFRLADMYCYGNACTEDREKALHLYCMAEFKKDYSGQISDSVMKEIHYLAPMRIKNLALQIPNGKEILRKYAGNKADKLIQEAESEAMINKMLENAAPLDQEHFSKMMNKALGKKY